MRHRLGRPGFYGWMKGLTLAQAFDFQLERPRTLPMLEQRTKQRVPPPQARDVSSVRGH